MRFFPDTITLPPVGEKPCFVCRRPTGLRVRYSRVMAKIAGALLLRPRGLPVCADCLRRAAAMGR